MTEHATHYSNTDLDLKSASPLDTLPVLGKDGFDLVPRTRTFPVHCDPEGIT